MKPLHTLTEKQQQEAPSSEENTEDVTTRRHQVKENQKDVTTQGLIKSKRSALRASSSQENQKIASSNK